MLTYEARQFIKAELSRIAREKLRKQPRNLFPARGKTNEGLDPGDARPWFTIAPHHTADAHRNHPMLDELDQAA